MHEPGLATRPSAVAPRSDRVLHVRDMRAMQDDRTCVRRPGAQEDPWQRWRARGVREGGYGDGYGQSGWGGVGCEGHADVLVLLGREEGELAPLCPSVEADVSSRYMS